MNLRYINNTKFETPKNTNEFILALEELCNAYDISLYTEQHLKSVDEVFKDITIAGLKYYQEVTWNK